MDAESGSSVARFESEPANAWAMNGASTTTPAEGQHLLKP